MLAGIPYCKGRCKIKTDMFFHTCFSPSSSSVNAVSWSPSGEHVISVDKGSRVVLWSGIWVKATRSWPSSALALNAPSSYTEEIAHDMLGIATQYGRVSLVEHPSRISELLTRHLDNGGLFCIYNHSQETCSLPAGVNHFRWYLQGFLPYQLLWLTSGHKATLLGLGFPPKVPGCLRALCFLFVATISITGSVDILCPSFPFPNLSKDTGLILRQTLEWEVLKVKCSYRWLVLCWWNSLKWRIAIALYRQGKVFACTVRELCTIFYIIVRSLPWKRNLVSYHWGQMLIFNCLFFKCGITAFVA